MTLHINYTSTKLEKTNIKKKRDISGKEERKVSYPLNIELVNKIKRKKSRIRWEI